MTKHILVIDDYEHLLYLLRSILEDEQYQVSVMCSGTGVHEQIQHDPPDLIILDLKLGDASGMDVLKSLRAHETTSAIPVLVYSAAILEADNVRQLVAGNPERYRGVAVLRKPFDLDLLLERVGKMIAAG
jgi:DNA-binding response OmpR family regulator